MKTAHVRTVLLALLLCGFLLTESTVMPAPAAAQVTPANALVGLFRVLNAINRRNRTYRAARDTKKDFDAYYASLRETARDQFRSGELSGLKFGPEGPEKTRLAAYLRLNAALTAEQGAVQRAIDAETNAGRRRFNQDLVRTAQDVFLQLPGAQQTLNQVRSLVSNVRTTVTNIRAAASASQPLDNYLSDLAQQVSGAPAVQNAVRDLGSLAGAQADHALGGVMAQAQTATSGVTQEADRTLEMLEALDNELSQYTLDQAEVTGGRIGSDPPSPQLVDRATAIVDVASQALAVLTAMQSSGGMTTEQLYAQIRAELLEQRNAGLLNAAMNVSAVECKSVSLADFEAASGVLGEAVPADTKEGKFYVCYDRDTGAPLSVWIGRVDLPTEAPEPQDPQPAEQPASEERWTLEQADGAPYMSFSGEITGQHTTPYDAQCVSTVKLTNTHPTDKLLVAYEKRTFLLDYTDKMEIFGFGLGPGESTDFNATWRTAYGDLHHEEYLTRVVAFRVSDAEGYTIPGTRWISETYGDWESLLTSGLTVVVPPNPCPR